MWPGVIACSPYPPGAGGGYGSRGVYAHPLRLPHPLRYSLSPAPGTVAFAIAVAVATAIERWVVNVLRC